MSKPKGRVRKVLTFGSPALRQKARTVQTITEETRQLMADLLATVLSREDALALAANQLGELQAVIAVNPKACEIEQEAFVLINPELKECSGEIERSEGCLSFPGIFEVLKRAQKVKVRAQNPEGKTIEVSAQGTLARALQHEIDHLNGVLIIDRISPTRRSLLKKALRELEKKSCA